MVELGKIYRWEMSTVCLWVTAITLISGIWPLNFVPRNHVTWSKDGKGVAFKERGLIYSQNPLTLWKDQAPGSRALSIEAWVTPQTRVSGYVAHILSFYDGRRPEAFTLGQWKDELILRSRRQDARSLEDYQEIGLADAFEMGKERFITVVLEETGTCFYVDGELQLSTHHLLSLFQHEELSMLLLLGNSAAGKNSWPGEISGLAIYDQPLSASRVMQHFRLWHTRDLSALAEEDGILALYPFEEGDGAIATDVTSHARNLIVSPVFRIFHRVFLSRPVEFFRGSSAYWIDLSINFFGFVPLDRKSVV